MGIPENYLDLFNTVKNITAEFGFSSLHSQIRAVDNLLTESKVIDVAILGQFKSGKSSFLNSLIGSSILPVGVTPVTSVITRLKYNDIQKISVNKVEGISFEILPHQISSFVSEKENPVNEKKILSVDIELSELKQFEGLRFVDTPGLGSVFGHNTDTTNIWIPNSSIAFVLTSAEKPLSESDIKMIREISQYCPEVIIIISKVDLYGKEHVEEISKFIDCSLQKEFKKKFRIYNYSVRKNTSEYQLRIIEEILIPLVDHFDEDYKKILLHKIHSLIKNCSDYLNMAIQVSLKETGERNKLKNIVLDEKLNTQLVKRELELIAKSYQDLTRDTILKKLECFINPISERIKENFKREFTGWKGNLYKVSRTFEMFLEDSIRNEFEVIMKQTDFDETLKEAKIHFANYINSFRKRLSENLYRVLGIMISTEKFEIDENTPSADISHIRAFDIHIDLLWFLFPMFIFRDLFKKRFLNQIPSEVEKNINRLASDLTNNVTKNINFSKKQSLQFMLKEISTIETILNTKHNMTNRIYQLKSAIEIEK